MLLPRDVVAAAGTKSESGRVVQAMAVPDDLAALDIGPETARGFADAIARAQDDLLERADGRVRVRAVRGRHAGGGARPSPARTARCRWSAAATRSRRSTRAASPTRSPTSRRAAARRWSSSRARSCPASRRWRAERSRWRPRRRPFFCGNWKLNGSIAESLALATDVRNGVATLRDVDVAVAPSFTALYAVAKRLEDGPVTVAAQDCFWEEKGAFTGRGLADAARRCRLQARHHRPLGAAAALRRARRGGEPEGARGPARRPDAHHLRRRDAGRARRGRDHRPRPGAARRGAGRPGRRGAASAW